MSELKTRWVYCVTRDYHWNKPDYSSFEITDEELTEKEAQALEWEARCEEANNVDYDREMCVTCYGTGEIDGEECEECCGTGECECEADFADHVERHTSSWLERYDPAKHAEVPSELPEHKEYEHNRKVEALHSRRGTINRRIEKLMYELDLAKEQLVEVQDALIELGEEL